MTEPRQRRLAPSRAPRRPGRLSRSGDFERAYRRGRSVASRHFVLYVFPRGHADEPRVGISVSRRLGGAVVRNRVKRLLREALRARGDQLERGHDYVVVARPDAGPLAERDGLAGFETAVTELLHAAGEGADE